MTQARQYALASKQYLEGARLLNTAQSKRGRMLFRPTLALAGHGLELMIKACFYLNGAEPPTHGNEGHKIHTLWQSDACEPLRLSILINAYIVAEIDRDEGVYRGVPEKSKVQPLIEEYVGELCKLHGQRGYPLRYPTASDQKAPRSPFLVGSLWRASDELVKRPNDFKLDRIDWLKSELEGI